MVLFTRPRRFCLLRGGEGSTQDPASQILTVDLVLRLAGVVRHRSAVGTGTSVFDLDLTQDIKYCTVSSSRGNMVDELQVMG